MILGARSTPAFAVRTVLLYALCVAPFHSASNLYAAAFRAVCNGVFSSCLSRASVTLSVRKADRPGWSDTDLTVVNRRTGAYGRIDYSLRHGAFVPFTLLVSLWLAAGWRRWARIGWLLLGLVLVTAFGMLRVGVSALEGWTTVTSAPWDPTWIASLRFFNRMVSSTAFTCVMPVLIWMATYFGNDEWRALLGTRADSTQKSDRRSGLDER